MRIHQHAHLPFAPSGRSAYPLPSSRRGTFLASRPPLPAGVSFSSLRPNARRSPQGPSLAPGGASTICVGTSWVRSSRSLGLDVLQRLPQVPPHTCGRHGPQAHNLGMSGVLLYSKMPILSARGEKTSALSILATEARPRSQATHSLATS